MHIALMNIGAMRNAKNVVLSVMCMAVVACGQVSHSEPDGNTMNLCFGTNPVAVCLSDAPAVPLVISSATTLNTENSSLCAKTSAPYCVLAGTSISIDAPLRATGQRPLVLVA